jgi:phosphonate ABC transporter permease subunit PhnE
MNENRASVGRSVLLGLAIIAAIIVYAYGFQVTDVDFSETRDPVRQTQLVRILRAIARPDILEYDTTEVTVEAPIYVPCPPGGVPPQPAPDTSSPYIVITPPCGEPNEEVTIEGFNFAPNSSGPISFIPPSGVSLQIGRMDTDGSGHFTLVAQLRDRPNQEAQTIRAVTRTTEGAPRFNRNAIDTWDKIIETVFLALLATTIGTLISIPVSFLAAQNLMRPITMPFTSIALAILVLPIGILIGTWVASRIGEASLLLTSNAVLNLAGVVVSPVVILGVARWAMPQVETAPPGPALRLARSAAMLAAAVIGIFFLYLLSSLALSLGDALRRSLGDFGFIGAFIAGLGDIVGILIVFTAACVSGLTVANAAGQLGQLMVERLPAAVNKVLNIVLGTAAGATLAVLIGAGIDWLYQLGNPTLTLYWPAAIGGLLGLLLALRLKANASVPVGYVVYYITRTILNALRKIEPLIMVIVFAVWVSIGPFAGTLALALHTIAALAKLYSEQVESIIAGPIEAITATGANRLQTIIYAVIPQVIPPYISFTMYRWDINVRTSTIIGFAGGGGIGFLLNQNIQLLQYRAASAQMLAIAIVVASMDYLSTKLREKVI